MTLGDIETVPQQLEADPVDVLGDIVWIVSDNVEEVVSTVERLEDLLYVIDTDIDILRSDSKSHSDRHSKAIDLIVVGLAKLVEDVDIISRNAVQLNTKFERLVTIIAGQVDSDCR